MRIVIVEQMSYVENVSVYRSKHSFRLANKQAVETKEIAFDLFSSSNSVNTSILDNDGMALSGNINNAHSNQTFRGRLKKHYRTSTGIFN